jgi:hypothetical protein
LLDRRNRTQAKLNFGAVPGLGSSGYTQSVCNVDRAEQAWGAYQSFLNDPGSWLSAPPSGILRAGICRSAEEKTK